MQENRKIFENYITELSESEDKPIDCKTCARFLNHKEWACFGEEDLIIAC